MRVIKVPGSGKEFAPGQEHECLIAVKEAGVIFPQDKYMVEANDHNADGIGIAFFKPGDTEVHIKKNFKSVAEFMKWTKENIKQEDICVIHFRLATHGLKDAGNRHPFPVTKNKKLLRETESVCQMAVAHNGVIRDYGHHDKFSDTQKFVLDILAEDAIKNNLQDRAVQKLINNFIDGDKLAILDNEGSLYYFGVFNEFEGIQYSNYSYKPVEYLPAYKYDPDKWKNWRKDAEKDTKQYWKDIDKKADKDVQYVDFCDGCHEKHLLREVTRGDDMFYLCKSCRKQARKNKLQIFLDYDAEIKKEDTVRCESCEDTVPKANSQIVYGSIVCDTCAKELEGYIEKNVGKTTLKDQN